MLNAVLFDFSDTLFWRNGAERLATLLGSTTGAASTNELARVWEDVKRTSWTPEELAKRRDSSAEAHRRCWIELLRPFDAFHSGAAELLYADQPNPLGWHVYEDTARVLRTLHDNGIPVGVVSDIGWDLRPVFAHHGVADLVTTWVLSYEHGTEKPDPLLFELGCAGLGSEPKNTLMVGDSVEKDAGAARAGLTALTLPAHSGSGDRGLRGALALLGVDAHR
jgi:HAD superfamily hydrolase (TIGR01493 family)